MEIIRELEATQGSKYSGQSPLAHKEDCAGGHRTDEGKAYVNVFLPCHYFDYIVGTSTGGFDIQDPLQISEFTN